MTKRAVNMFVVILFFCFALVSGTRDDHDRDRQNN